MGATPPLTPARSLRGARLPRPRLLPLTIAAMTALFALKSVVLVKAAAEESRTATRSEPPVSAHPLNPDQTASPAGGMSKNANQTEAHSTSTTGQEKLAAKPESTQPPVADAERAILLDLRHRREGLDLRARELDERDAELAAVDKRLQERLQQLETLQSKLESLEQARQQHSSENWSGLVKTYETMKPRDAATIFDSLDMQVLLQVLDRMQERRVAPILAAMQPDRARLATQMLAEMRTRAATLPELAPHSPPPAKLN